MPAGMLLCRCGPWTAEFTFMLWLNHRCSSLLLGTLPSVPRSSRQWGLRLLVLLFLTNRRHPPGTSWCPGGLAITLWQRCFDKMRVCFWMRRHGSMEMRTEELQKENKKSCCWTSEKEDDFTRTSGRIHVQATNQT